MKRILFAIILIATLLNIWLHNLPLLLYIIDILFNHIIIKNINIIIRSLLKVLQLQDPYKILAISGLICSFGLQCLINIFSSLGLIPTKGMTLPFVSYGGSSMISIAILFGFLLSLTNKRNEELWKKIFC